MFTLPFALYNAILHSITKRFHKDLCLDVFTTSGPVMTLNLRNCVSFYEGVYLEGWVKLGTNFLKKKKKKKKKKTDFCAE